ncbi:protein of unknown function (plasmid) [Cupriavidus taiwanensis]|uniref:Uncharacterized protein n=1 Tax=Cupriavidus taiwanensis TaxID=164546 RepID=A0A9Q7XTE2_9BURK|nr:protein of unknown function [Cupriavidus taiwanensis]
MIPITAGWIASFYSGSCWRNDPANFPVIARLPPHAWHLFLWEGSGWRGGSPAAAPHAPIISGQAHGHGAHRCARTRYRG